MIRLLLGFSLLTFTNVYAVDLETCQVEISQFGKAPMTDGCKELLLLEAKGNNSRKDDFEKGSVHAVDGALFYKTNKVEVFAGEYAAVKEPVAVVSDSQKGEIAFLNNSGDVATYSTRFFGNISPARKLVSKSLYGAKDICLSESNIFALIPSENKIVLFDRMANSNASEGRKRDQLLKEFNYGSKSFVSMGCSLSGDKIYLLDSQADLYLYETEKKSLRKIKSQTGWDSLSVPKN